MAALPIFLGLFLFSSPAFASTFGISAWVPNESPWTPLGFQGKGIQSAQSHIDLFDSISPFAYVVSGTASFVDKSGISKNQWDKLFLEAKKKKVEIIPTILWGDKIKIHAMLASPEQRAAHVAAINELALKNQFDGVDIDYEAKYLSDKDLFSDFLLQLRATFASGGKKLVCTVEGRTSENPPSSLAKNVRFPWANDYAVLNQVCDRVRIMAYDEYYLKYGSNAFSTPTPIFQSVSNASLSYVQNILQYATTRIEPQKIVLGIPTYGYEFSYSTSTKNNALAVVKKRAHSYVSASKLAASLNLRSELTEAGEKGFFYTTPLLKQNRFVTFSDRETVEERIRLAKKFGIGGVVLFKIDGAEDPLLWSTLSRVGEHLPENAQNFPLEKKIGQMLLVGFDGKTFTPDLQNLLAAVHPGGVLLLSKNIDNPEQLKKLIRDLQDFSLKDTGLPLFVAVDQEGGPIRRVPWLEDSVSQSKIKTAGQAYRTGLARGKSLNSLGINLNLAPVLDATKKSDFLHSRAFQKGPKEAGALAKSLIEGQKAAGVLSALKHFPGYVNVSYNPETKRLPIVSSVPESSQFRYASDAKPEFVMTANVIYKDVDKNLPFSFSSVGIRELKKKMPGEYLVMSDDLSSDVLMDKFSLGQVFALTVKAGGDILLTSEDDRSALEDASNVLLSAVRNGEITEEQIDISAAKIIRLKQKIFQLIKGR